MSAETDLRRDAGLDLSDWLVEATRRKGACSGAAEPSEDLIVYMEQLAGRRMRSREDIKLYFDGLRAERDALEYGRKRRRLAWESMLLVVTVGAYLQLYFWNVYIEIESLPRIVVFSALETDAPKTSTGRPPG